MLAVIGAFDRRARAAPLWVWAVPLLMYLSVVFLVVETPRYRTAIDPFIVLLAALAVTRVYARWRPSGPVSHSPSSCGSASQRFGVGAPALDQRARELGREEQVAHQLAVQRVRVGVDEPAEERQLRRAVHVQQPAGSGGGRRRGRSGRSCRASAARRRCTGSAARCSPTSSLIVVSVWMSSTSGSASSASMICAAPAARSGRWSGLARLLALGRDRVQADDDHALGAERQRGLDRRVEPGAAVEVPGARRSRPPGTAPGSRSTRGRGARRASSGRSRSGACRRGGPRARPGGRRRCGRCARRWRRPRRRAARPLATCSSMRSNGIACASVLASGVASSSAGMSSESRPVKLTAPRTSRSRSLRLGRGEHVAPLEVLPDLAAGGEVGSSPSGQRRGDVGAVDRADARADDRCWGAG